MKIQPIKELVVTYLIELQNGGVKSLSKAGLMVYLDSIGIKETEDQIDNLIKNDTLVLLKSKRVILNPVRHKR